MKSTIVGRDSALSIIFCALSAPTCLGQANQPVTLTIEVQPAKPSISTYGPVRSNTRLSTRGRIVSINGHPAAGSWFAVTEPHPFSTAVPSVSADSRPALVWTFEIAEPDNTIAGTIVAMQIIGSGETMLGHGRDLSIVSGTGVYVGIYGSISATNGTARDQASKLTFSADLTPAASPSIATVSEGPAITHADSSIVTIDHPAMPGEVLTAYATDLIPNPQSSTEDAGSTILLTGRLPVSVSIGEVDAHVFYAGSYPGSPSGYQINFQVPSTIALGITQVQIFAGFIPSSPVQLPIYQ